MGVKVEIEVYDAPTFIGRVINRIKNIFRRIVG